VFASFFYVFVICRCRLSFFSSSRAFLRAAEVSRKGRGRERGRRGELTDPFCKLERDVGLEVIHHEEVSVGVFHREGFSAVAGGGALEGPWGEEFP